ncbi:hypothetical protein [Nonomuraea typhae]|uniref:Uncharacterized protein n=1 Tax=Nonomuraea typhae TaxID=2603600 RepID=A0ABW7YMT3_9ACTN
MDDLDARFQELVSQIPEDEQRQMREAAAKAARQARPAPRRARRSGGSAGSWGSSGHGGGRRRRGWLAVVVAFAVLVSAGSVLAFRPDFLSPAVPDGLPSIEDPLLSADPQIPSDPQLSEDPQIPSDPQLSEDPRPSDDPRPADPFAGSPEAGFADGAAGFVMPAAEALGGLPEKDVATGLERVRELMIAAYLDPTAIMGGPATRLRGLLEPGQREKADALVTAFAPGTAELATDVIKVDGTAGISPHKDGGVRVTVRYRVVYAVQPVGRPQQVVRLTVRPHGTFRLHERGRVLVEDLRADATPARCDTGDRFIHPVYPGSDSGCRNATEA